MSGDSIKNRLTKCVPDETPREIFPAPTEPFSLCAGDFRLDWDGARATLVRTRNTPDGDYGRVSLQDGCIVAYGEIPQPVYSPPVCAGGGSGDTGGGSTPTAVSSAVNNLTTLTTGGLLTTLNYEAGTNVAITGTGTAGDPIRIAFGGTGAGAGGTLTPANAPIRITYPAAGVTAIGLAPTGVQPGVYAGFAVNEFGLITNYNPTEDNPDNVSIIAGLDLETEQNNGSVIITHNSSPAGSTAYAVGAFNMELNQSGHIVSMERSITIEEGDYQLGNFIVTIDEFGSIAAIEAAPVSPDNQSDLIRESFILRIGSNGQVLFSNIPGATLTGFQSVGQDFLRYSYNIPIEVNFPASTKVTLTRLTPDAATSIDSAQGSVLQVEGREGSMDAVIYMEGYTLT